MFIYIITAGTYGGKEARLYSMVVSNTEASGSIFDKKNNNPDDDINTNTGSYSIILGWYSLYFT